MRLYATTADAWPSNPPANADLLLRTASRTVDRLLTGRAYDTDPATGLPTDTDVAQALQDATVAVALELAATGTMDAGSTTQYDAVGIGNVSLSGRSAADGTVTVAGIPVPAAAIAALADVGPMAVYVGTPGCPRPLDRIAP